MNYSDFIRGDKYTGLLHNGQIVNSVLYGGRTGYITNIDGIQQPETVKQIGGFVSMGGNANISIRFEDGHESTIPECVIKGVQWYIGPEPTTDKVIADCLIKSAEIEIEYCAAVKRIAAEKAAAIAKRNQDYIDLQQKYSYLETVKDYESRTGKRYCDRVCAAQNVRTELKRVFPGVTFSVKSKSFSGGDDITVSWDDGPTEKAINEIISKYSDHAMDETGDYCDPTNEAFNELFGGAKFVFASRHMSEATEATLRPWAENMFSQKDGFAQMSCGVENLIWKLVSGYDIPANCQVLNVEKKQGVSIGCDISDFYELVLSKA